MRNSALLLLCFFALLFAGCNLDDQNPPVQVSDDVDVEDGGSDGQSDDVFDAEDTVEVGTPDTSPDGDVSDVAGEDAACESDEVCDGQDNDCDGLIDEGENGMVLSRPCGTSCPDRGVELCERGFWGECGSPAVEICDGIDNNCDSRADNPSECYLACPGGGTAVGTLSCGADSVTCTPPADICGDGLDNNCDGEVDETCRGGVGPRSQMVFVPGGTFLMGAEDGTLDAQDDEFPQHTVELSPFYIDKFEVSVADWEECAQAGRCVVDLGCIEGSGNATASSELPAVCMSFQEAQTYCQWRGKRIPTEAEWEKAASGPFPLDPLYANGTDSVTKAEAVFECAEQDWATCTVPVASTPAPISHYGVHHMSGNVSEWTADFYDETFYQPGYVVDPFQGQSRDRGHTVRGGHYFGDKSFTRSSNRSPPPNFTGDPRGRGFRCAQDVN